MWWLRFELFHGWMVLSLRILTLLRMMQQTIRVNIYLFKCSASSSPYYPFSYLLFVCLFAVGSHCGRSAAMEDARTNTESALESGECALDWCLFSCNFHKFSMEISVKCGKMANLRSHSISRHIVIGWLPVMPPSSSSTAHSHSDSNGVADARGMPRDKPREWLNLCRVNTKELCSRWR